MLLAWNFARALRNYFNAIFVTDTTWMYTCSVTGQISFHAEKMCTLKLRLRGGCCLIFKVSWYLGYFYYLVQNLAFPLFQLMQSCQIHQFLWIYIPWTGFCFCIPSEDGAKRWYTYSALGYVFSISVWDWCVWLVPALCDVHEIIIWSTVKTVSTIRGG